MRTSLTLAFFLVITLLLPASVDAAYEGGSEPFALGHEDGIEVPRLYSTVMSLHSDEVSALTDFIIRTENTTQDADPVLMVLDEDTGQPIAIEDDDDYVQYAIYPPGPRWMLRFG